MVAVIVGTHGKFSQEIVRSSEMIFGKQENVGVVTFEPGEGADGLVQKYTEVMKGLDCTQGVLFMVDLFGGSPFNAASRIAVNNENMDIVTGVSLPMLLEVYGSRSFLSVSELVETAKNAAKDAVKSFKSSVEDNEEEEL
ncbi:PTS mannose transporter subunit IID [Clostridium polyendosporum]|uniref:PTS mannose transporter subunit IID n=1 Tax=Clostridium polyendosporum TaxID=69208 RepID=A0A919S251_9CLOT|nr:mannose/fructose/sorbose PTS transporter subunit IIA [Clostridium polyendosporum]GIM30382.1 PTS mannose transporter subunit IID [Clostridium polyendosporum]